MDVRFSRHAIQRLKERFTGVMSSVTSVIELGIREQYTNPAPSVRREIEGFVRGRPVRVVVAREATGVFKVVTAMWCLPWRW